MRRAYLTFASEVAEFGFLTMQSKTKAPTVVIGARIPEPMKDKLTEAAQQAGRSLGQEIIHRLAVAELVIGRRLAT